MNGEVRLLEAAEEDLEAARAWYESQLPGLGGSFLSCVYDAFRHIEHFPAQYQIRFAAVRCAITHRFPFAIYYRIVGATIEVSAILDCRMDPEQVRDRFDN